MKWWATRNPISSFHGLPSTADKWNPKKRDAAQILWQFLLIFQFKCRTQQNRWELEKDWDAQNSCTAFELKDEKKLQQYLCHIPTIWNIHYLYLHIVHENIHICLVQKIGSAFGFAVLCNGCTLSQLTHWKQCTSFVANSSSQQLLSRMADSNKNSDSRGNMQFTAFVTIRKKKESRHVKMWKSCHN